MGFMPKRGLNVNECEVARAYKVGHSIVEPISFTVPRKSDAFQSDIFPPCLSDEPALTADEWFEGKNADPKLVDLEAGFTAKAKKEFVPTAAPVEEVKNEPSSPVKEKNYQEAYHEMRKENDDLKNQLSQRDVKIRVLEIELEKLRTELAEVSLAKKTEEGELPHSGNALVE
ncbi:Putative Coronin [Rhizopus microsporus]|nr:Putative Coronin [Rhizopus microsporus]